MCSTHTALFRRQGGSKEDLDAIRKILNKVRQDALAISESEGIDEKTYIVQNRTVSNWSWGEYLKEHPLVVAASILMLGISLGWTAAYKIWIEPNKLKIQELESTLSKLHRDDGDRLNSGKRETDRKKDRK